MASRRHREKKTRRRRMRGGDGMEDVAAVDPSSTTAREPTLVQRIRSSKFNPLNWFGTGTQSGTQSGTQNAGRHRRGHKKGGKKTRRT